MFDVYRTPRPMRAFLAGLAFLALHAAMASTQTSAQTTPESVFKPGPNPLMASVNGHEIYLADVFASIESLPLGDQVDVRGDLNMYIEAMINEEMLFQWALRNTMVSDPVLRREIKDMVVRRLIDKHVRSRINISDVDVRRYYDTNPSLVRGEHVRVRRILLKSRPQCERMLTRIDSEKSFIELAKTHSLERQTAPTGGDSGLIMRGEGERIGYEMKFFDMKVGEMRIFNLPQGCLLVRSIFYVKPPMPSFEAAKGELRQYLEDREEMLLVEQLFNTASKGIRVQRLYRASEAESSQ